MKEETKKTKQRHHQLPVVNRIKTMNQNLGLKADGVVSVTTSNLNDPDCQCTVLAEPVEIEVIIKKKAAHEPEITVRMNGGAVKAQTSAKAEYLSIANKECRENQKLEVELLERRIQIYQSATEFYMKKALKVVDIMSSSALRRLYLLTEEKFQNAWKNIITFATSLSIHMVKSDREIDKVKEEIAHEEQKSRKVNIQEERNLAEEEEKLAAQRALNKHIECYGEYPDPKYHRDTYNLCVKHGLIPEPEPKKEDEASEEA